MNWNSLEYKINESNEIIKQAINLKDNDVPLIVNFSGGKDSVTTLLLAREITSNVIAFYMDSSIELPGCAEHATQVAKQLGIEMIISHAQDYQGDFAYWVRKRGYFPTIEHNYCTSRLKLRPSRAEFRKHWGLRTVSKLTGVRRYESTRRARIYKADRTIEKDIEHSGAWTVHPILNWSDSNILEYLAHQDITLESPLYKQTGVSGCYWCPYYQVHIIERIERTFPNIYNPIIDLEDELQKPSLNNHKYLKYVIEGIKAQSVMKLE